jgi:hypothetical protein
LITFRLLEEIWPENWVVFVDIFLFFVTGLDGSDLLVVADYLAELKTAYILRIVFGDITHN